MKSAVFFLLFAVAAVSAAVTDLDNPEITDTRDSRANGITLGTVGNGRLLRSFIVTRAATVNSLVSDVRYTAPAGVRITAVRAREVGVSQIAGVSRVAGGVGSNFVTLRFRNSPRRGFHFRVEVWGR